ncbi:MAG: peptide deformylase [Candidatus Omnitrophota bacterium]|nr:peptide deformylase [Candidatus Omnitrophota bacterium]
MESLQLKIYPDPCLRIRTKAVEHFTPDLKDLLRKIADIMYLKQGIGLAATQVGLGLSVILVDIGEGLTNFVNPVVIEKSKKRSSMEEGCLSLPGITVNVSRPEEVKVRAQDGNGEFFIRKFDGLMAVAVQHEVDHLHGKLIIDYLDPIRRFIARKRISGLRGRKNIEPIL